MKFGLISCLCLFLLLVSCARPPLGSYQDAVNDLKNYAITLSNAVYTFDLLAFVIISAMAVDDTWMSRFIFAVLFAMIMRTIQYQLRSVDLDRLLCFQSVDLTSSDHQLDVFQQTECEIIFRSIGVGVLMIPAVMLGIIFMPLFGGRLNGMVFGRDRNILHLFADRLLPELI